MNGDGETNGDASAGARQRRPRASRGGRKRGDPVLSPRMRQIAKLVGRDKLVPDITAMERHYSRSLNFRERILEFLATNEGTVWSTVSELRNRAANEAGCSSPTAGRWIEQYTAGNGPFRLVRDVDRYILEARGGR